MKQIIAYGFFAVVLVEVAALVLGRGWLPVVSGAVTAAVLVAARRFIGHATEPEIELGDGMPEPLRRWHSRTERLISLADSTQGDWDRQLRPLLARQFELATGHQQRKDREAYRATGEMLFGPQLWALVDPAGVRRTDSNLPAPGRDVLGEILTRIERL